MKRRLVSAAALCCLGSSQAVGSVAPLSLLQRRQLSNEAFRIDGGTYTKLVRWRGGGGGSKGGSGGASTLEREGSAVSEVAEDGCIDTTSDDDDVGDLLADGETSSTDAGDDSLPASSSTRFGDSFTKGTNGPAAAKAASLGTAKRGGIASTIMSKVFHIEKHELPMFAAMSSMMFWIIYIFTMTRDTKDTLIVTNCGAEAIAFLKVYGVVPAAAMFMVGYNWLSNHVSHQALFRLTIIPFFLFYALFAFVLFPLRGKLHHPDGALSMDDHPLAYLWNLGRFWMFSLYYVVSELWGSAGVPLLFWTCANDVTPVSKAKRLYPLLALFGNLAPIASGQTMAYVSRHRDQSLKEDDAFEHSIKVLSGIMLAAGVLVLGLYEAVQHMHQKELRSHPEYKEEAAHLARKNKPKMGLLESFRFLSQSRYLLYIGLMVVSYGLSMEFTEIIWKAIVKLAFPAKSDYMAFMGDYSTIVGVCTVIMLLAGNKVIKYLGWEAGALMTPLMMALLSVPFFGFVAFGDVRQSRKRLMMAVYIGMIQNVLSKSTKYALFDPTKEMAYIPLDKEYKVKGKAAIDVLGARLGKSGGALAQQGLVVLFGTILGGAPVLAFLFALVSIMWVSSVIKLGKLFHEKTAALLIAEEEKLKHQADPKVQAAAAKAKAAALQAETAAKSKKRQ